MSTAQKLIGAWELVCFDLTLSDGRIVHPLGSKPIGRIYYDENGFMSAHLMPGGDLPVNDDAQLDTAVSALSYCGRFHVENERVLHDVDICSRAGWVGTTQIRDMEFDGPTLILKTQHSVYGKLEGKGALHWQRLSQD